jgi:hypothetical protein
VSVPPINLAMFLHYTYEQLAPKFGYETRESTRTWDADSPNGQLMIAVCEKLGASFRIDMPLPPPESFQYGDAPTLAVFNKAGILQIAVDTEQLEDLSRFHTSVETRAMARLLVEIVRLRTQLAKAL